MKEQVKKALKELINEALEAQVPGCDVIIEKGEITLLEAIILVDDVTALERLYEYDKYCTRLCGCDFMKNIDKSDIDNNSCLKLIISLKLIDPERCRKLAEQAAEISLQEIREIQEKKA